MYQAMLLLLMSNILCTVQCGEPKVAAIQEECDHSSSDSEGYADVLRARQGGKDVAIAYDSESDDDEAKVAASAAVAVKKIQGSGKRATQSFPIAAKDIRTIIGSLGTVTIASSDGDDKVTVAADDNLLPYLRPIENNDSIVCMSNDNGRTMHADEWSAASPIAYTLYLTAATRASLTTLISHTAMRIASSIGNANTQLQIAHSTKDQFSCEADLKLQTLRIIANEGTMSFNSLNICEKLVCSSRGLLSINSGATPVAELNIYGEGAIDAAKFAITALTLRNYGIGEISVWAKIVRQPVPSKGRVVFNCKAVHSRQDSAGAAAIDLVAAHHKKYGGKKIEWKARKS